LCGGGTGWCGFGCDAEKPGELQPPEEFFVWFAEEVVVALGGVNAGEPADVGVGPEGGGDYWFGMGGDGA
jgi:hypothetical protein